MRCGETAEEANKRKFRRRLVYLGLFGFALAVCSDIGLWVEDGSNLPWDAGREIGGAIVAGAIVAWAVLKYEDLRDDQLFKAEERRENERDNKAEARLERAATAALERERQHAHRAWRQPVDLELHTLIRDELTDGRRRVLIGLERRTQESRLKIDFTGADGVQELGRTIRESVTRLELLQDGALWDAFRAWAESMRLHRIDIAPPAPKRDALTPIWGIDDQPGRDEAAHAESATAEAEAWDTFLAV